MAYCDHCDRYFNSDISLFSHKVHSSKHNFCCGKEFATRSRLQQHWIQSSQHDYCQHCERMFDDSDELEEHYQEEHSYCNVCGKVFKNDYGLKQHYSQSDQHHYCPSCDRHFRSENNLGNHLRSSIHRSKDIHCPFRCGSTFIENSHLVLHLEAGSCSSGINRKTVDKVVRQYDKHNVITDPSRLITAGSSRDVEDVTYIATSASWNGQAFQCYLCHRTFSALKGLNQHLASPVHQDEIYICRGPSCGSRFSTLSALCQHIESEKCGVRRFSVAQTMENLFRQMNRLTF